MILRNLKSEVEMLEKENNNLRFQVDHLQNIVMKRGEEVIDGLTGSKNMGSN
jgi:hypothetical protein